MALEKPNGARVCVSLFNLFVELEQDGVYPDQVQDLANRAISVFHQAVLICKENQLDIRDLELEEEDD